MSRFASDAFWRVQRFSTDWHANNFAGAIVRRVTRGMWAVDTMDDILLLDMLPALLVLVGSSLMLGLRWPGMGVVVAGGALTYIAISVSLSLYLVGQSGSGKTTFVKLLHRLYDVGAGRIVIDGQDTGFVTQDSLRAQLALVPQDPILFHRTLAENIAYGRPDAAIGEIEKAARLANAHEFILRQHKGYQTLVGERGLKLSGGERQRVALARAFLADTPILVLDEATSSLDSETEALIQQAMERLMEGRTSIVIAHRLSTVRMMDRILVFESGRVVEEGKHDELIRRERGTYRRLFERQALGLVPGGEASFDDYPELLRNTLNS